MKKYVFLLLSAVLVLCAGSVVFGSHEIHKPEKKIILVDADYSVLSDVVVNLPVGSTFCYGDYPHMDLEMSVIYGLPEMSVFYIENYKPKGELNSKSLQKNYIINFARSNC